MGGLSPKNGSENKYWVSIYIELIISYHVEVDNDMMRQPPLRLGVDPDRLRLTLIRYAEPVDVAKLDKLLRTEFVLKTSKQSTKAWSKSFSSQRYQVTKLREKVNLVDGDIPVCYQFAHGNMQQYGRVYPMGHLSFGELAGDIRAYILGDLWTALDFANCHPSIMYQVLKANGFACPNLEEYCLTRETLLKTVMLEYNVDRDAAKELFIRLLYLGTFEAWANDNSVHTATPLSFIKSFSKEMQQNADIIVKENPKLQESLIPNQRALAKKRLPGRPPAKVQKVDQEEQPQASRDQVVATFCHEHERRALLHFFDFLGAKGILDVFKQPVKCMLRYDGIDILKVDFAKSGDPDSLFAEAQAYIASKTGLQLQVTEKRYPLISPLAEQIENEANLVGRIPENAKHELDTGKLIALRDYPAQKFYFERFVAKIMHISNFAWVQKSEVQKIERAIQITKRRLSESFEHIRSVVMTEKGETECSFIQHWMLDPQMRTCNDVNFVPFNADLGGAPAMDKVFNLFRGFSVPRNIELSHKPNHYLDAFHYIGLQLCENDPLMYQFLWEYIAHLVQHPADRVDLSFVFQDKPQGAGADTWFNAVGGLLGEPYYKNSSNIGDFLATHAEGIENKLLVVMNELEIGNSTEFQSRIKDLITCRRTTINAKHQRPYEVDVFAFIVFFSNKSNAINFDNNDNERRFVVMKPTRSCCHNFTDDDWRYLNCELFTSLQFRLALYQQLMKVDLKNWRPKQRRELTLSESYCISSERNAPFHAKFLAQYLRDLAQEGANSSDKNTASTKRPASWELPEACQIDRDIQIPQSFLREKYHLFVSNQIGSQAKQGGFDRSFILRTYNGVIHEKKSGELKYYFNPRCLWQHLVEKKWVLESFKYQREKFQKEREHALTNEVDPLFKHLMEKDPGVVGSKRPL